VLFRSHWLSETVKDFVVEPHQAIASEAAGTNLLNMVAIDSDRARATVTELSHEPPDRIVGQLKKLKEPSMPARHEVMLDDIRPENLAKAFLSSYERQPEDFEALLGMKGVGAKTIRALSLIAELVYDTPASHRDPALFSFAHGGKDGYPYPVDRENYDRSIEVLRRALAKSKVGKTEQIKAFRRLAAFEEEPGEGGEKQ